MHNDAYTCAIMTRADLVQLRVNACLSKLTMAERCGVAYATILRFEADKPMRDYIVAKLEKAYLNLA